MTNTPCPCPVVVHRGTDAWECTNPLCATGRETHTATLPCRWSWPYAHGKAWGGRPFPAYTCPQCQHIRRAGTPQIRTASTTPEAQAAARAAP